MEAAAAATRDTCVVCCETIVFFVIAPCTASHPVCSQCCTRLRVLQEDFRCPVCRSDMPWVVFSPNQMLWDEVPWRDKPPGPDSRKFFRVDNKHGIAFSTDKSSYEFSDMTRLFCHVCNLTCGDIRFLKNHLRKEHNLRLCEICLENLKIFPFEYQYYQTSQLAEHNRTGQGVKGQRGHPECEFCRRRFLDAEKLTEHHKRDHWFCHFCDADGFPDYFKDYPQLQHHFRTVHFLCEEGNCANDALTNSFRKEIDFNAHKIKEHGSSYSKKEREKLKQIELQFNSGLTSSRNLRSADRSRVGVIRGNSSRDRPPRDSSPGADSQSSSLSGFYDVIAPHSALPITEQHQLKTTIAAPVASAQPQPTFQPPANPPAEDFPGLPTTNAPGAGFWSQFDATSMTARRDQEFPALTDGPTPTPAYSTWLNLDQQLAAAPAVKPKTKGKKKKKQNAMMTFEEEEKSHIKLGSTSKEPVDLEPLGKTRSSPRPMGGVTPPPGLEEPPKCATASSSLVEPTSSATGQQSLTNGVAKMAVSSISDCLPPGFDQPSGGADGDQTDSTAAVGPPGFSPRDGDDGDTPERYSYCYPADFDERNLSLNAMIRQILDEKQRADFARFTSNFRNNKGNAGLFVNLCMKHFAERFNLVFRDLLCLLDNIDAQQRLFEAYLNTGQTLLRESVFSCPICKQVLARKDEEAHYKKAHGTPSQDNSRTASPLPPSYHAASSAIDGKPARVGGGGHRPKKSHSQAKRDHNANSIKFSFDQK